MREIRAVIFDNDGRLNDIERVRNSLWPVAAEQHGYPGFKATDFLVTLGKTSADVVEAVRLVVCPQLPSQEGKALAETIRGTRNQLVNNQLDSHGVAAKRGALETLAFLNDLRMPVALWTSSKGDDARRLLDLTGLRKYFPDNHIVSGDMVRKGKPNPEGALETARRLGIAPKYCAGVDDTQVGSDAFGEAGMFSIRIPDLEPVPPGVLRSVDAKFPCLLTMKAWMQKLRYDGSNAALVVDENCITE